MSTVAGYRGRSVLLFMAPMLLVVFAFMGWSYLESRRPEPFDTYGRRLPPLSSPAAAPFDDPALPYTFTVPAGLVAMPDTGGADVRLAAEAWFPTDAAVSVTAHTLDASTDDLSEAELIAAARDSKYGPNDEDEVTVVSAADGSRVLVWAGCCATPAPFHALVYNGKRAALVVADTPDNDDDATGALNTAARELVASFAWR